MIKEKHGDPGGMMNSVRPSFNLRQQRRRAASNYQTLEDQAAERNVAGGEGNWQPNSSSARVIRPGGVFERLQAKFGFQDGNVANQKEHFECWVLNYESRMETPLGPDSEEAVLLVHARFFKNYKKWCKFLNITPYTADNMPPGTAEMQVALFLLVWGEAGNLRFMPECLCFLYHSLASKLETMDKMPKVPEGTFLRRVVRPLYLVVAKMRNVASGGTKPLDHKNITNYDDVNEFFWSISCLEYDEFNVAEAINLQEFKTFKERRSFLNPFLAFFRVYFFLLVMLHLLIVIAYVAYRSDPSSTDGWSFYSNMFSSDIKDIRNHAFYSVFLTFSGLLMLKVVLEIWIGGIRIFMRLAHALVLFLRLIWHAIFFALFLAVNFAPYKVLFGSSELLSMGPAFIAVYAAPVVIAAIVQMFCKKMVWSVNLLNTFDGTRDQYIGRNMGQTWGSFIMYGLFWTVIFALKFLFNLQLMVKPLIGPSVQLYDITISSDNSLLESNHNLAFITALWAPVILVYIYDSQIWLAIMQAIVGTFIGIRMKIGHSSRIPEFTSRLKAAPVLFDQKVVSSTARGQLSIENMSASQISPEANSRLRFAVVWNEIVSSFRLSDLLDDRETAILQYQISDSGVVEDPVFLIAGQAQIASDIATKARARRHDDARLKKDLEKAGVLGCANNCIDICFQILTQLLGQQDHEIIQVFREIISAGKINSVVNLVHAPLVRENMVDLLANILDLPEPTVVPVGGTYGFQNDQVTVIVQRVDALLKSVELLLEEEWMAEKVRQSVFAKMTPDLTYQKDQLLSIFSDRLSGRDSNETRRTSPSSNESVISLSTRLFFLLTLDAADALPRCHEAQRRMSFFLNSLSMKMPSIQSIASMHSFSVITPYYNESVLYSIDELNGRVNSNPLFQKVEQKGRDLSILKYLITFHSDEWGNFLERVGATTIEEALAETPTQVRLWASMRGQTLARTVHGMMLYEDALKMLRWLEIGSDQALTHLEKIKHMDRIAGLKFSYVTSCQIYSDQLAAGDSRAADIDLLMRKYPNWRVSYVDTIRPPAGSGTEPRFDCVLVKSDGDEIVEVYRYELPGNPMVGEGKPENQNVALPFTRGEYVQTIDMNQEHYFEEALKIPNFLATGTENGADVAIIGMKEHIFTGRASSLARFMTLQELVFVSLTQRVMANPLRSRMHYGHPDVFEKSFVMTNGGVSKASKGINLSEDVFSGYNATLRGENVTHIEFMQCGKGRDVTLSQINAFEAKLANGSAESSLTRDAHRMGIGMDFFRLNSMFYGHMGFYICNALTVLCVFCYSYAKLYVALHYTLEETVITKTSTLDDLAAVMNTQFIFQFGMLMTIPLIATLFVEFGWRQAFLNFAEMVLTLGPVFYIFETGTKAHFYDVAMMRGGSKYRGTGRGFAIIRETMVNFFKEYAASHYRKAVELIGIMILFGIYGDFHIGKNALQDYCDDMGIEDCDTATIPTNVTMLQSYSSKGQDYGIASFAVWLLGACWLYAPFFFNTDGMDFAKTRVDIGNFLRWMMSAPFVADEEGLPSGNSKSSTSDSWTEFFLYEADLNLNMQWTARAIYAIRELRHPLVMYYIFTDHFDLSDLAVLGACIVGIALVLWIGGFGLGMCMKNKIVLVRSVLYIVFVVGGITAVPFIVGSGSDWSSQKSLSMMIGIYTGLYTILQYMLILHGAMGIPFAKWGLVIELGFLFDTIVGIFLIVPLLVLSAFPFMRTIQTRMMYNGGFSRALSTGSEFAASLSMMVGMISGFSYGWLTCLIFSLGYVNDSDDHFINESFIYFVNTELGTDFELENMKVFAAGAAAIGAIISVVLAHMLGRRMAIGVSCVVVLAGSGMVFVTSSSVILLACCLASAGISMLSVSTILYNFEICMKGWKGKGVLIFLFASSISYFIEALVLNGINSTAISKDWSNKPLHNWQYQFVIGAAPLVLLLPTLCFLPDSPNWLLRHRDQKSAEATLAKLRQRHDVAEEVEELKDSFMNKGRINVSFRIVVVLLLQITFGLMNSNALLPRIVLQVNSSSTGAQTSKWMVYFGLMVMVGVIMSLLTVDNIRRKTIFKDILPLTAILSVVCGALGSAGHQESTITQIVLCVLYASGALSLTCATWLTAIEIFPPYCNGRYIALSFAVYYAVQAAIFVAKPGFAISHFIFAALCAILTAIMFLFCASTKAGAICLKAEKKQRIAEEGSGSLDEEIPSFAARASRSQSFRRSRVTRRSSSRHQNRTPMEGGGTYEQFESPNMNDHRRTMNTSIQFTTA